MKVRTHFRIETDIKDMLESICKSQKKTQSEMIEEIILFYRMKKLEEDKMCQEIEFVNNKILEYVALLVKGNQQLPNEEKAMNFLVQSESRFDEIINQKINMI